MIETFKHFINVIASPVYFFTISSVQMALFLIFPRFWTSKPVAGTVGILAVAFFIFGLTDDHLRSIMTLPDNVPIIGMLFIFGYFTWYAMKKAVDNDDRIKAGKPTIEKEESEDKVMVFPYLIYIEFVAALFYAILLVVWSIFLQAPLEDPANPTLAPNPSKAPWYFLGLQEMLVYFDPWIAGVLFPTLIIVGLCAIPYIDKDPKDSGFYSYESTTERKWGIRAFMFGFWILWNLLILYGTFFRGPNWNFFGPFEPWDVHKIVPLVNVNLSEYIYIKWLGQGLPSAWYIREAPGIVITFIYLIVPPLILAKIGIFKKYIEKHGMVRYSILMLLIMTMVSLPIKMYLRWLFNLKYIVAIPEFFFNI